jgi:hypothetical protein
VTHTDSPSAVFKVFTEVSNWSSNVIMIDTVWLASEDLLSSTLFGTSDRWIFFAYGSNLLVGILDASTLTIIAVIIELFPGFCISSKFHVIAFLDMAVAVMGTTTVSAFTSTILCKLTEIVSVSLNPVEE